MHIRHESTVARMADGKPAQPDNASPDVLYVDKAQFIGAMQNLIGNYEKTQKGSIEYIEALTAILRFIADNIDVVYYVNSVNVVKVICNKAGDLLKELIACITPEETHKRRVLIDMYFALRTVEFLLMQA